MFCCECLLSFEKFTSNFPENLSVTLSNFGECQNFHRKLKRCIRGTQQDLEEYHASLFEAICTTVIHWREEVNSSISCTCACVRIQTPHTWTFAMSPQGQRNLGGCQCCCLWRIKLPIDYWKELEVCLHLAWVNKIVYLFSMLCRIEILEAEPRVNPSSNKAFSVNAATW